MPDLQETLRAKLKLAEQLVAHIRTLPKESEEGKYTIYRWAVIGDETQKLMIQAEEQLSPAQLARLKAEINGIEVGALDRWAKYREGEWRLPRFGAPGPGDEPPPIVPIRDFLE